MCHCTESICMQGIKSPRKEDNGERDRFAWAELLLDDNVLVGNQRERKRDDGRRCEATCGWEDRSP